MSRRRHPPRRLFPPQPRHFAIVYIPIGEERGFIVFEKEIYMKRIDYSVSIDNGKTGDDRFACGYSTWHENVGATSGPAISGAGNNVAALFAANTDPKGELTATLVAKIDGVAQPSIVHTLSYDNLSAIEDRIGPLVVAFAGQSSKHAKGKAAKHGHK